MNLVIKVFIYLFILDAVLSTRGDRFILLGVAAQSLWDYCPQNANFIQPALVLYTGQTAAFRPSKFT